ncbi:MAG: hypothetical protein MUE63_10155, partial [Xanthomonadales bacterium]|nr:hypothetical protein [Xanthomonadales bacterium]
CTPIFSHCVENSIPGTSLGAPGRDAASRSASGQQQLQQTASLAKLCEQLGLLASCGSDFHEPGNPWSELGRFRPLPDYLAPVWERF